jgi:hypothetical protein
MPSGIYFTSGLLLPPTSPQGERPTVAPHEQCLLGTAPALLRAQVTSAFEKPPSLARIFHGARRIRQGGRGRRTSLFPSSKCGGNIPLESQLELAYAVVLERSPDVQEYRTQAIRIALPGGRFSHPDFLIQRTNGTVEVHEVKPSIEDLPLADMQRFALIRSLLAEAGVAFQLIDTRSLPSAGVLQDLLQRYSRGHLQAFSKGQVDLAMSLLAHRGRCTYGDAAQLLAQHDLPAQIVDFLIFHHQWDCDQRPAKPFGLRGDR